MICLLKKLERLYSAEEIKSSVKTTLQLGNRYSIQMDKTLTLEKIRKIVFRLKNKAFSKKESSLTWEVILFRSRSKVKVITRVIAHTHMNN